MNRTPKRGEVWTSFVGKQFTCTDDEPDMAGRFGWLAENGYKSYDHVATLAPPKAEPPDWMADAIFNVYPDGVFIQARARARFVANRTGHDRLGTVRLDLSTWGESQP